ncbi:hypothetical protein D3C84_859330 [compost metagenome]
MTVFFRNPLQRTGIEKCRSRGAIGQAELIAGEPGIVRQLAVEHAVHSLQGGALLGQIAVRSDDAIQDNVLHWGLKVVVADPVPQTDLQRSVPIPRNQAVLPGKIVIQVFNDDRGLRHI